MTSFVDGPAMGIDPLMLRRSPVLLRVVRGPDGEWDALDCLDDEAGLGEELFLYILSEKPSPMHILFIGKDPGACGWYPISTYKFSPEQPSQETMRDFDAWGAWCEANRERLMPEWYHLYLRDPRGGA